MVETPETRSRIEAIAERETISQAQVVRDVIAAGLDEREAESFRRTGSTSAS